MKTIGVTDLRQHAAEVLDELRTSDEPTVVMQRSRKVAYLVDASAYEEMERLLTVARRELFLREVREAETEYASGRTARFEEVDALLRDLAD